MVLNNGLILQWGQKTCTSTYDNSQFITITFPITCSSTKCVLTRQGGGRSTGQTIEWVDNLTSTSMVVGTFQCVNGGGDYNGLMNFLLMGY